MDAMDKGLAPDPGGTEQGGGTLHRAPQNSAQFETHELFISGVFHVVFQTPESGTA